MAAIVLLPLIRGHRGPVDDRLGSGLCVYTKPSWHPLDALAYATLLLRRILVRCGGPSPAPMAVNYGLSSSFDSWNILGNSWTESASSSIDPYLIQRNDRICGCITNSSHLLQSVVSVGGTALWTASVMIVCDL